MPLLRVAQLHAGYEIPVLFGVSLELKAGEIVAVVGPNGAGKSTLLRCLSGTANYVSGEMELDGTDLRAVAPHDRSLMGLVHVPQGRRIFPSLSVEQNLQVGASFRRLSRSDVKNRLDEVYELFPLLVEMRHRGGAMLSGGQQQMLAIARGLMAHPRVLMLDEPSLGLGPVVVQTMFEKLREVHASRGTAMVIVEQRIPETLAMADSVFVMVNGVTAVANAPAGELTPEVITAAYLGGSHSPPAGATHP